MLCSQHPLSQIWADQSWARSGLPAQALSSWIPGSSGDFPPVWGCPSLAWSSRGSFHPPHPPKAAVLPFQTGNFQTAIYRSPSKQTRLCGAQTRLCSQKPVCSSCRNSSRRRGCCISSEIGGCLHPWDVTAATAKPSQALRAL